MFFQEFLEEGIGPGSSNIEHCDKNTVGNNVFVAEFLSSFQKGAQSIYRSKTGLYRDEEKVCSDHSIIGKDAQ